MSAQRRPFVVRDADYAGDFALLRLVREAVFVAEQRVPRELELDAMDPSCRHVLALDPEYRPIGTGRLTPQRTIGRMAVLPAWRGQGIGDAMLRHLLASAASMGWPEISLHAQLAAVGFYRRHGFETYGAEYLEAGIGHQSMRIILADVATGGN